MKIVQKQEKIFKNSKKILSIMIIEDGYIYDIQLLRESVEYIVVSIRKKAKLFSDCVCECYNIFRCLWDKGIIM